ncbi:MAG TPA: D-2-hydroxyacid dehydrogenase [Candidatus Limiplasma stercoravium]|nr:D-2-hydroxyacid dehydrogenase [Candidatus Limiplasma stercoravium]
MKIVILDGYTENPGDLSWEGLEKLGELTVYEHTQPQDILSRIADAEVVLTNKTPISAQTIDAKPNLKYIGILATGFNVVDIDAAKRRGIVVANIPTYGTTAVAQYVFALLLEICHHVGHHNQAVQEGRWTACRDFCFWDYPLIELAGKTMGIIGYGRIGRATAQIARAFGMKVVAYDAFATGEELVSLDELLSQSDVISLHCPLTRENTGLINRDTLAKMKDGAIIINTARGPLINEPDLREALLSGKVLGAALDVVAVEPIQSDNVLLGLDNCLITPHIAWAPKESRQRLMDVAVENVAAFLAGQPINNVAK